MDRYKLKWTKLQQEIFRYLSINSGSSVNQRGIASALGVSPTAVAKSIKKLEEDKFVVASAHPKINLISYEFNRDNKKAIEMKRTGNLKLIYESELTGFLEEKFPGCTIILFGSYSRGEDTKDSDIDIAIIGAKEKRVDLKRFEKKLEREIRINFYKSFKEIDKELKENLFNGIVLSGGIEL